MKEKILIILFMIFLVVPSIVYYIWFQNDIIDENKALAEAPVYKGDIDLFIGDFESYYTDRLPFKKHLISLKNSVDLKLVGELDTSNIMIGLDGWFFYKGDHYKDDALQKYMGGSKYTEDKLEDVYNRVAKVINNLEEKGLKVQVMIAASKESVYHEYFNPKYKKAEENITDAFVEYMTNKGIDILYTRDLLIEKKEQEQVFYKTDSHWNAIGAYYGAQALLKKLGKEIPTFTYQSTPFKGDLVPLLGIIDYKVEDTLYIPNFEKKYDIEETKISEKNFYYLNKSIKDNSTIFLVGDSFRNEMLKYIDRYYNKTYMLHSNRLDKDYLPDSSIEVKKGDTVVFEVVERYLSIQIPYELERFEQIINFKD